MPPSAGLVGFAVRIDGENLLLRRTSLSSVLDGGDEMAEDWLEAFPLLVASASVEFVGGDEPNGERF